MSADGNPAHDRMRTLTDSARKRNRKEVLAYYNKTRINIGHQHDCWMELKEGLRVHKNISGKNVHIYYLVLWFDL
jgi:hypothetical protein